MCSYDEFIRDPKNTERALYLLRDLAKAFHYYCHQGDGIPEEYFALYEEVEAFCEPLTWGRTLRA